MCDSYKLPIGETVTTKKGEKGFFDRDFLSRTTNADQRTQQR